MRVSRTKKIAEGLLLILKYDKDADIVLGDGKLWCGRVLKMSQQDLQNMKDWGWFDDEDLWCHYVE